MTVKELIEQLSAYPGDTLVILQEDQEGNGYGSVRGAEEAQAMTYDNGWSWETLHPQDIEDGEYDQDTIDSSTPVVVIYP